MPFRTKLDFTNRQAKQYERTDIELSGKSSFGLCYSALTSGPDLETSGETFNDIYAVSTYSGNTGTTVYSFLYPEMDTDQGDLSPLTPANSGTTQTAGPNWRGYNMFTTVDGFTGYSNYSAVTYTVNVDEMVDFGGGAYSGSINSDVTFYSATTLDYTGSTIWADVSGITRTKGLVVSDNPTIGYVLTCDDTLGKAIWGPSSGGSFTGNTSATCITDLYITNLYGCSPITIHDGVQSNGSNVTGTTEFAFGDNVTATGTSSHGFGINNIVGGIASSVGGQDNIVLGNYCIIGGGHDNAIGTGGTRAIIGTGQDNYVNSTNCGIFTGNDNSVESFGSVIAGGRLNVINISTNESFIGTGVQNEINGGTPSRYSAIVAGRNNEVNGGNHAFIGAGRFNTVTRTFSSIIGGYQNTLSGGSHSIIGGGSNHISTATRGFIGSGSGNTISGTDTVIGGGKLNNASGTRTFIGGGSGNTVGGQATVVAGGEGNTATSFWGVVAGGYLNSVTGDRSGIIGGQGNSVVAPSSIIAGGYGNLIVSTGSASFIAGGQYNVIASGVDNSAVIGGTNITATTNNMVYVPDLVINGLTSVTDLQTDSTGLIIDGASDITLKDNVEEIKNPLETILKLKPVSFEWKPEMKLREGKVFGLIAQDVQEVIPEIVRERANGGGTLTLDYKEIIPWLIGAVQELGTSRLSLKEYTPVSSSDKIGASGDAVWDADYIYIKTNDGWKRSSLTNF